MDTTRHLKKFALTLAGAFIAIVAVIINLDQLYLMAAVLFLIPLASYLVGLAMLRGLNCVRQSVPACHEGQLVTVKLTLENTGRLPKLYLRTEDRLPAPLRFIGEDQPLILQLGPGETAQVEYQIEAKKRGAYLLGPAVITSSDPLGFYTHIQTLAATTEMLVYPTVLPLRQLSFSGDGAWGQREMDNMSVRGGLDFHGVREYQPGDELRRVHWRTTARTGSLAVMEYTQGTASDVLVALDLHPAAYSANEEERDISLEQAVRITASACDYLLRTGYVVRVALPPLTAAPLHLTEPGELPILLEQLARVQATAEDTLAETLGRGMAWTKAGQTLLYITPDAQSPALAHALTECAARGAHVFGYALDKEIVHSSELNTVVWVKPGDNLIHLMEGKNTRG